MLVQLTVQYVYEYLLRAVIKDIVRVNLQGNKKIDKNMNIFLNVCSVFFQAKKVAAVNGQPASTANVLKNDPKNDSNLPKKNTLESSTAGKGHATSVVKNNTTSPATKNELSTHIPLKKEPTTPNPPKKESTTTHPPKKDSTTPNPPRKESTTPVSSKKDSTTPTSAKKELTTTITIKKEPKSESTPPKRKSETIDTDEDDVPLVSGYFPIFRLLFYLIFY